MPRNIYVVHSLKNGSRNIPAENENKRDEHSNFAKAFASFKRMQKFGYELGLFHWNANGECTRMYSTEGYRLERDFPPRGVS